MNKTCDTREPVAIKMGMSYRGWDVEVLDAGDFRFHDGIDQTVGIERKTIEQLLTDMYSGQLAKQLDKLRHTVDIPILLVEGSWRVSDSGELLDSNYTWNDVWDQLQTLQDEFGIRIQLTHDIPHTIERIDRLSIYYSKEVHLSTHRKSSTDLRISTLCQINKIGPKKAKKLLERFRSLGMIALAPKETLVEVDDIGQKAADDIFNFWWEQYKSE